MKLEEVTNIRQTRDEREVNLLLAQGYKIIKILSSKSSTGGGDEVFPIYILGLMKEGVKEK